MSDIKKDVNIIAKCESVFSHIVVLNLTKDLTFSHDTKIQNDKRLYKMIKSDTAPRTTSKLVPGGE